MTNRPKHDPNPESNEVVYNFFNGIYWTTLLIIKQMNTMN